MPMHSRVLTMAGLFALLAAFVAVAAEPPPAADRWLTNDSVLPEKFAGAKVETNRFATLRAETVAGALQVLAAADKTLSEPQLIISADTPGHWRARDWRTLPMRVAGANWTVEIPVE